MLAALLLANAVRDYLFVWRILAAQQVRHQLTQYVAGLEQALRRQAAPAVLSPELLEGEAAAPPPGTAWIEVRRSDGSVLARRGERGARTFTPEEESLRFRSHEPLHRIVSRAGQELVVQAVPFYPGRRAAPLGAPPAATSPAAAPPPGPGSPGPGGRPFFIVEVAAPLVISDTSVLWPIRWNLLLNSAGALALFVTVAVAGLGFRSYERGRWLESQLEIARAVQSKLLPSRTAESGPVRTAAVYRPSEQVGGDFYDLFRTGAGHFALVIGDVSGKGLPAALLTGVVHGAVRSTAWSGSPENQDRESGRLNRLLCANSSGNRFVSMFWCYYDEPARRLHYVNAGHCPPILVRCATAGRTTESLDEGGPVLGLLPEASYEPAEREVASGDVLVLYSDGLVECTNETGEEYGEARLRELLRGAAAESPDAICRSVTDSLAGFLGGRALADDLTLVVAQFR